MRDAQLRAVLHGLGIDEDTSHALLLLPLVEVAWADGSIQDKERAVIMRVAHEHGLLTAEGERLLETWLRFPPSERYLARGRMVLVELAHRGRNADVGLTPRTLRDAVGLCEEVAAAAGGFFDRWATVEESEKQAIDEIADALSLDPERNWDELFGELDRGGLPVSTGPAPLAEADEDSFDTTDVHGEPTGLLELLGAVDADTVTEATPPPPASSAAQDAAEAVTPAGPALVLVSDDAAPTVFAIEGRRAQIGRRPDSDVRVRWDGEVSRQHCRLFGDGGGWYVADSGSVNGTWVNDERVLERRLFGGEDLRVGQTRFRFLN